MGREGLYAIRIVRGIAIYQNMEDSKLNATIIVSSMV